MRTLSERRKELLSALPSVDAVLSSPILEPVRARFRHDLLVRLTREALARCRNAILEADETELRRAPDVAQIARNVATALDASRLAIRRVVNVTGTITHTNLGRSLLSEEAIEAMTLAARHYVNLEYDLDSGERGHRDALIEGPLSRLTGAEAATVVNNNAAAVMLVLRALAEGREVIVSRGELIEIGGSFRIPDVMRAANVRLREVGTTNRTHPRDYAEAIGEETALLLKVHPSNYRIEGFTREVSVEELVEIGRSRRVPVMEDLGSGALLDLRRWGLPHEPVVAESVRAGVDVVTFSGDKLLGASQAGVIVGSRGAIERVRRHPLMRALRVGKLTCAALAATLDLYESLPDLDKRLPMVRFMTRPLDELRELSEACAARWRVALGASATVQIESSVAQIGSGAQPTARIESVAVTLSPRGHSVERCARALRQAPVPVIARVDGGRLWLDLRTTREDDIPPLDAAIEHLARVLEAEHSEGGPPSCDT